MTSASAPPRVAALLRSVGDAAATVVHRGPDAAYVEVAGRCVGVLSARATRVPCALRTTVPALPAVREASVRGGVLHLDDAPVVVGRLVDVTVPRLALAGSVADLDVAALIGRGDGLTPYGDDVVCGWLAVTRAARIATPAVDTVVRSLWHRTTLLSATLLDCALHGEVVPEFAAWLRGGPVAPLAAVGHTSGRGLVEGAQLALAGLERMAA